jgi:hypothetical protein
VLYNIPPGTRTLPEGANPGLLPASCREGLNDWNRVGYGGPMPPVGQHRYIFRLFALNVVMPDLGRVTRDQLLAAMEGHIVAEAQLIGTYEKYHANVIPASPA